MPEERINVSIKKKIWNLEGFTDEFNKLVSRYDDKLDQEVNSMQEYKEYTKEEIEKFCEDNFISEGFDEKLITFLEGESAILEMDSADVPDDKDGKHTELTIKCKLTAR